MVRIIALLILSVQALAQEGPVPHIPEAARPQAEPSQGLCEDLASFSCSPGVYDDGTGVSRAKSILESPVAEAKKNLIEPAKKKFLELLNNPDNAYFRGLALSAVGLADSPDCQSAAVEDQARCQENVLQGLLEMSFRRLLPLEDDEFAQGILGPDHLEDKFLLTSNPLYQKVEDELKGMLFKDLNQTGVMEKVRTKIYPKVKELMLKLVERAVPDPRHRQLILDKLKNVTLEEGGCTEEGDPSLVEDYQRNASYDPATNTLSLCNGLLWGNQSEFLLAFIIGHELGHAWDPCLITKGPKSHRIVYQGKTLPEMAKEFPVAGIIDCIQENTARHMKMNSDSFSEDLEIPLEIKIEGVPVGEDNRKAKTFCDPGMRIGEQFADAVGTELLPEYMRQIHPELLKDQRKMRIGYSNVLRSICDRTTMHYKPQSEPHPPVADRINQIVLTNRGVRSQMGCPPEHSQFQSCPFGGQGW